MRLLLINNNPAVSRLINLSAEKYGYEIEEFKNDDFDLNKDYDVTIADNEAVNENSILLLKESGCLGEIIYIGPKGLSKPAYAEYFLQKPFLPTDFIDLVKKVEELKHKKEANLEDSDNSSDKEYGDIEDTEKEDVIALDLDDMDSLDLPMSDDNFFEYKEKETEESMDEKEFKLEEIEGDMDLEKFDSEVDIDDVLKDDILTEDLAKPEELEESKEDVPEELKLDEDENFEGGDNAILDSEDIDEVKQLLDEDITLKETKEFDDAKSDEMAEEMILAEDEDIEDDIDALLSETNIEEALDDVDMQDEILDDLIQESEELQQPEDILKEIDDIDAKSDLRNVIENEDIREPVEASEIDSREDSKSAKDTAKILSAEKSSIDELLEDDFGGLFEFESTKKEVKKSEIDINEIKEELQTRIVSDVKKALDKDEIREALKGLKVNISISFDEE